MSFKPAFKFAGQTELGLNAQAFATHREAELSALARFQRWTMPIGYDVVESDEPVNYRWDDELGDVRIPDEEMVNEEAEYYAELNRGFAKDRI